MKHNYIRVVGAAVLASGMLLAQAPAPAAPQPPAPSRQWRRGQFLEKLSDQLNLTGDQRQQARSILEATHESAQPVAQQLRQQRLALRKAVKAGKSDAEIDQLSAAAGALTGQLTAIRTKGFAKIYALLTPDQRAKAQELGEQIRGMLMNRWQHGHGGSSGS